MEKQHAPSLDFSMWKDHLAPLAALLIMAITFTSPILFSGKRLAGHDTVQWRAMAEDAIQYEEQTGEKALWVNNLFGGMPSYLINGNKVVPNVDTIVSQINRLAHPFGLTIVMLLGTYAAGLLLTGRRSSGLLAALFFSFTTYLPVILSAGHNSKYATLAYAPLIIAGFLYVLRKRSLFSMALFALALGLQLRAGHIQISYYLAVGMAIWFSFEIVQRIRQGNSKEALNITLLLIGGAVLGIGMMAQPLLSQIEYKDFSIRGSNLGGGDGTLAWDYAMAWSQGIGELLTMLVANAFGGSGMTYWGPKPGTSGPHYVGGLVLLLSLLAYTSTRKTQVGALITGASVMTIFALGEHAAGINRMMFDHFPLFSTFRAPETWLSMVALWLALLGALGWEVIETHVSKGKLTQQRRVLYTLLAGLAVVLLIRVAGPSALTFERPGEVARVAAQIAQQNNVPTNDPRVAQAAADYIDSLADDRLDLYTADATRTLLVVGAGIAIIWLLFSGTLTTPVAVSAILLVGLVDLYGVAHRYLNEEGLSNRDIARNIPMYDFDRFLVQKAEELGGKGHFRVLSLEGDPLSNARPAMYHESIGGYHAAKLRVTQDYLDLMLFYYGDKGAPAPAGLDMMNVRYIVSPRRIPTFPERFRDERTGMFVLERPQAADRAWLVGSYFIEPDPLQTIDRIQNDFNVKRSAILKERPVAEVVPIGPSSVARVSLLSYDNHEIRWEVETDAPRLFVAAEFYYPAGWKAYLNDEERDIVPVNYVNRGVFVEAGKHQLVMRFEPASHRTGTWISAISTLLAFGLLAFSVILRGRKAA